MKNTIDKPNWKLLLIGGSSGTGKTQAAMELARTFGAACSQIDDFRLVLQRMTTAEQEPVLHFFTSTKAVWQRSPEELCERLIEVGKLVSRGLEIVIAHHLDVGPPLVLEGDGILPSLATQHSFAGLEVEAGQVRSVFLYEPDEKAIETSMEARGRGFQHITEAEQQTQVRMSYLYGEWLHAEVNRLGLPIIESRPWETLADRIVEVTQ